MWVCRLPVHIGPAECTVFTVFFGEFATSQRADVGIGPYYTVRIRTACKYGEAYPAPLFSPTNSTNQPHKTELEERIMNFPAELKYSRDHEWVKMLDDTTALVGITDFAQSELGDLVYVNLPEPGDEVLAGETACDVESVKAVSDLVCPVTGAVCAVNEELLDQPELLNKAPYDAWLIKVENVTDTEELLDAAAYEAEDSRRKERLDLHNQAEVLAYKVDEALSKCKKELDKDEKNRIKADVANLRRCLRKDKPEKMNETEEANLRQAKSQLEASANHLMVLYSTEQDAGQQ